MTDDGEQSYHARGFCEYVKQDFRRGKQGDPCPFCGREIGAPIDSEPIAKPMFAVADGGMTVSAVDVEPEPVEVLDTDVAILVMLRGFGWFLLWLTVSGVLVGFALAGDSALARVLSLGAGLIGFVGLLMAYVKSSM